MRIKLRYRDGDCEIESNLSCVEEIYFINKNLTLCNEIKNSILIIHTGNSIEKYRVYKDAIILKIDNKDD